MRRESLIYRALNKALLDRAFLKETGKTRREMERKIASAGLWEMAQELSDLLLENPRFDSREVVKVAAEYFGTLNEEPPEGWLSWCFRDILHQLFETMPEPEHRAVYEEGSVLLLQILRGLYAYEEENLPFDPTRSMVFLTDDEIEEGGYTREYIKLHHLVKHRYFYEFMRIGTDITPFNTLGHIGGVHYVAMHVARQLAEAGAPVDLGIVSGAAAGHDIGKYGCRKSEERRIPYLHYYYTDRCYDRFGMPTIGHIAANHSTWDLELENLSAESLILIYADFRVKSCRDGNGRERVCFYTLADAFDVILNKLDNVDEAKKQRYQRVYDKLEDFEDYMKERGVDVALPEIPSRYPAHCGKPRKREMVLLEGEEVIEQLRYKAIDHNIRLMSRFHVDAEFGNLIEAARSEQNWKNIRTYVSILGEYSTYMTERQKLMTIRFLYELLAHKEGDIRSQAAELLGQIVGTFNEEYKKELPEGESLPDKAVTNLTLFAEYLQKIIEPDYKLTDQHKKWIRNSLNSFSAAVLRFCKPSCLYNYMNILIDYYRRTDYDEEIIMILLKTIMELREEECSRQEITILDEFIRSAGESGTEKLAVAAVHADSALHGRGVGREHVEHLKKVVGITEEQSFTERMSNMFLDDLKAGTPWVVKVANIEMMIDYVIRPENKGEILHVATHLSNLIKVSETVTVRRTAGRGLLTIVDRMSPEQRNELSVELFNGLEIGDYQFSKYIPDYLGNVVLRLPPQELDEFINTLERVVGTGNDKLISATINTIGVILENYSEYRDRFREPEKCWNSRRIRLLYMLIRGYANYDKLASREAFWVMGKYLFGSTEMSLDEKDELFLHCHKKLLALLHEKTEDALEFYNNAAVLNSLYRYICEHRAQKGEFCFPARRKVAFYPGTFDPFSLGHKAVARTIRNMGFDVYLALDEFSWSKNTQPRLQRRKIMNMSVADEEGIYPFPDDFSVNIANNDDVRRLKQAFEGRELYIAVGSDVVRHASCYRKAPAEDSIHGMNHIVFARESKEQERCPQDARIYPITGKVITLTLKKYYEDISSTRIRENIDLNRDISNLIDPVAQNYIYEKSLYLREPAYKHVLQAREISISSYSSQSPETLEPIRRDLEGMGYDFGKIAEYLEREKTRGLYIESAGRSRRCVAYAAAHRLETNQLLREFGDLKIASHIREAAAGGIAAIGFLYTKKSRSISNISQIVLTEILTELISRDFAYAVYHPVDAAGMNPRIIDALKKQGFVNIAEGRGGKPVYAVDMRSPIVIFRDVETMIKNPLNKRSAVLRAIDEAHGNLLKVMTEIHPGQLVLSFNTSAVHNKIIRRVAEINGVPPVHDKSGLRGPYMTVPFGKALADVLVPNTVTKVLHTEKYFNSDLDGFTIRESRYYSPLDSQARAIRSFDRPVILIDDLLHKGYRMNIIDPILKKNEVDVRKIVVGVMTGNARDAMEVRGREVESAYFLPTLKIWLNERDCYPFIGGDSLTPANDKDGLRSGSINLIMPYTTPVFIADGNVGEIFRYSMTCLENARNIWQIIEKEYQSIYERKLTLKRIGEVITYPRIPEMGTGIELDENLAPTAFIDNAIARLIRLKWGKKKA
ncbi:hypothetical protein [Hornefia butyriciproducens]|uniref:nicotinate-nicotinamide nucleotide adenylyltransferase n=1 Tax=Hornefia butyriciproducens TaxID=2652293 RepID=UPI0029F8C2D4|nr:hypothetical protein [Hornefia butyriciproducens]MDD7020022.1 hypothetical protein [Hornefia butyriciproducens]MDY5463475.1 hypothetical protein [Hornefia butyriciproducens]